MLCLVSVLIVSSCFGRLCWAELKTTTGPYSGLHKYGPLHFPKLRKTAPHLCLHK